jgi:hypothetical protein
MSEELKRKLYDYEVDPSEKMWNKIVVALDEEINAQFPQKLYEAEVNPPVGTWNKIASALETGIKDEYPSKLYNLEVTPPADTWQKISAAIEEEKTIPRIHSKRRVIPFVKYAVAACFIGVIAFGALKLVNRKTINRAVAEKTVAPQPVSPIAIPPDTTKNSSVQPVPVLSNNLPKQGTALVRANVASRKKSFAQQTGYMTLLADASTGVTNASALNFQQASLRVGEVPGNCAAISEEDRYLSFMNPDGYLIRISKKLAEALKCSYPTQSTQDNLCDEQIKKWRDKIAQSPASSSPDNFMDVLNIIRAAQDKEL